jgi:hypothetical protein
MRAATLGSTARATAVHRRSTSSLESLSAREPLRAAILGALGVDRARHLLATRRDESRDAHGRSQHGLHARLELGGRVHALGSLVPPRRAGVAKTGAGCSDAGSAPTDATERAAASSPSSPSPRSPTRCSPASASPPSPSPSHCAPPAPSRPPLPRPASSTLTHPNAAALTHVSSSRKAPTTEPRPSPRPPSRKPALPRRLRGCRAPASVR